MAQGYISSARRLDGVGNSRGRGRRSPNVDGGGGVVEGRFYILCMPGDDLLSHGVVPSAQERFTVEFEMGSSGGVPL